ncbi:lysophospholipid acyltransferase [Phlyctochytrium bullatum]|nr:lysophospholipid acyltransferase [Phlyctochytrium bullatum]
MNLDQHLEQLSADLSVPIDSLKAGSVLLGSYLFALLYFLLPSTGRYAAAIRHLYSIVISTSLFLLLFSVSGIVEIVTTSLIVYAITLNAKSNPYMPVVCFFLVMGHLCWALLRTQVFSSDEARFDVTAPMMMLVIKLSSFAWSVYDATRPENDLSKEQKVKAVRNFPSLLEYFGFVFFFPSFLVGPALEFRDYQAFINKEAPFHQIPSRSFAVIKCLLYAAGSLVIYVKFSAAWSYDQAAKPSFLDLPIWQRFFFLQVAGTVARTKFYVAWKLSEGACNLTGIGYTGWNQEQGRHVWDRASNVKILAYEFGQNPKVMLESWNQKTASWLRNYVYLRLTKPGKKPHPMVTVATYLVSAFWHGFYPGYYLTFFCGAILNLAARSVRTNIRPFFISPSRLSHLKPVYDVVGWFVSQTFFNYMVAPFQVWSLSASLFIWGSLYYVPVIAIFFLAFGVEPLGLGSAIRRIGRGLGAEYGKRTNEAVLNEKAGGLAAKEAKLEGKANGHANGHANGYVNGYANGHANGYANGRINGKKLK